MKKEMRIGKLLVSTLALAILITSCRTPAKPAAKILTLKNSEWLKKYELIPVQKAWKAKRVNLRDYTKIVVKPVDTNKQLKANELQNINLDKLLGVDKAKKLREFAKYTENAFKKAIRKDPRLSLATSPGPNTMILKLALVQVIPGKPLLGAARNIPFPTDAGFIIAPAIKALAGEVEDLQASVAIEGEMIDSLTKQPIAMFADREKETKAIINTALLTSYGSSEEIVDDWAALFCLVMNRTPGQKVTSPKKTTIIHLK